MTRVAQFSLLCMLAACVAKDPPSTTADNKTGPQVPDGYVIEIAADSTLVDFPMFSTLDEYGRLFVFESTGDKYNKTEDAIGNPQFRINLLEDTDADGKYDKSTIFADKVGFPQGGVFYKGSLYASSAPDLIKFTDSNSDGVADQREVILSGWVLNVNANSLVGPSLSPDGWFYMTNAIEGFDVTTKEGQHLKGETARTWRVRPDGTGLEWISAGGMNNPVELAYTEAAEPIGTETYFTEPQAGERDALVYWIEGGVYPKPNNNIKRDRLPLTGELMPVVSKYSRVAPSGIGRYRQKGLGDDFKDNLFSAQFNTHRVLRHKLIRQGASFRTEDEIFFWNNNNEDFHPTDVLEDADGSLLVVETGGWFIKGCPLSQVSKPQLKGAIYRVRKKDAKRADDPYGNTIKWTTLGPDALVKYLEDSNPFLADRAQQFLVDGGDGSVIALKQLLSASESADARTKAVFTLNRIGTPLAMEGVRTALKDGDDQVAVAAARSVGMSKDKQALASLLVAVANGHDPLRRQAATALGQIGDKQAVTALIDASSETDDRFIRHAIIHALTTINDVHGVRSRLSDTSARVREVVIITLDQMPSSPLTAKELTPFLTHRNKKLQQTALWAASHHPEWSGEMVTFLEKELKGNESLASNEKLLSDMLISFGAEPKMQKFIADKVGTASRDRQLFLISAMMRMNMKEFPAVWTSRLTSMLESGTNAEVKSKVIELVQLRSIKSAEKSLASVADDKQNPAPLRMQAIEAFSAGNRKLSEAHFDYLLNQLTQKGEVANTQQAAAILEKSELTDNELKIMSDKYLPQADPFILPRLVSAFQGGRSAEVGKALATTLSNSSTLDGYSEERLRKVFEHYPPDVKPDVDKLIEKLNAVHAERIKYLKEIEASLGDGVLDNGRALFFGKATCFTCHKIGSEGGQFGPDLTSIQRDRSTHDLLEAIVYPGASFVREYETYKVQTANGEHTGIVKSKTPDEVILATSLQSSIRIPKSDIKSTVLSDVSMMPQGLDKLLTKKELADLMAFLQGQDQDPETDQRILRHTVNQ
ncbi:PVC-type heme-binding CxxCH protein [Chryseolinea sp. T2]|uniref:PVC-type heme-binding CxxCH protein n=1 Tax=Chryseolinea sp. T2 TaxID=3129255 RepID=UPI003076DEFD